MNASLNDPIEKPEDQILVVFGASGDLTKRKLIPALFQLFLRGLLPSKFAIIGAARTPYTEGEFRAFQSKSILEYHSGKTPVDMAKLDAFLRLLHYVSFDTDTDAAYALLNGKITQVREETGIPDRILFYLGTPPNMYEVVPRALKSQDLHRTRAVDGWRRIVVEKPFGRDLNSALALNKHLLSIFHEKEIFRIDHYLGKETVQNMLVLRFANGIFEPLWNRNFIDCVEIGATETLGVEKRASYYDHSGAMRDMVQNHLMHLMAFVAMEPPPAFEPENIRDEIVKVFRSLRHFTPDDIRTRALRGQYAAGKIDDKPVPAYRDEPGVAPNSATETYVALKMGIDNWRWSGVPFFLYTGKRLDSRQSEVVIHFKSTPHQLFQSQCTGASCNRLVIRIQPDEGIALRFGFKKPGAAFDVRQVSMDFRYDSLSQRQLPEAYERLLLDAMKGDFLLYARADALEESWKFVDPILAQWQKDGDSSLAFYPSGGDGPEQAYSLMQELFLNDTCPYEPAEGIEAKLYTEA